MRSSKRRLSFCLAVAMLMTLLTFPSVFGEESQSDGILLTEDFEGDTNAFDVNCTNVDAFGGKSGKVGEIDLGSCSAVLDFDDVSSGAVKVSFDAYIISGGNRPVMASPAADSESSADYQLLQIFQNKFRKKDSSATEDLVCTGTANNWYRIEQVLDLEKGTVTTTVYSMDGTAIGSGTEAVGCDSIGKITFKNWSTGTNFYIDNIQIETCEIPAPEGVLAEENFEGDTNKFESENETFEGYNAGRVLKNTTVTMELDDVYSGGIKISLDAYAQNKSGANVNGVIKANPGEASSSSNALDILQVFQHRVRYVTGDKTNIYAGENGWIHIEQVLNLADGTAKTYIYSMDGALLAEGEENVGVSSIGGLSINSMGSMDFYMDNVKVETCDPTEEPEEPVTPPEGDEPTDEPERPDVFVSEDFEGETNVFSANCNNVTFDGVEGQVGAVLPNPTGSGQYMSTLDFADAEGGGVKISYDLYLVSGQNHYIKALPVSGKEYPLLHINGLGLSTTNGGGAFCTAKAKGWVRIEQIMKLDMNTVETYVYSMDGELFGKTFNNVGYSSIANIVFCNWGAAAQLSLYLDNILVENYDIPPMLSGASFVKMDYSGNVITEVEGVTPGLAEISMDFGTKMDDETLCTIKLQKKGGTEIKTVGKLNDMVYTLSLLQGLEPECTYEIVVPETVAAKSGITLGNEFVYEFTTGAGKTAVAAVGITKGENMVTELSQLAAGDTVTVSVGYGNRKENAFPVTVVLTYYSGKSMTDIDAYTISVPSGFGIINQDIIIPSLSGVDRIKVVALNGLYSMVAYHSPIVIN